MNTRKTCLTLSGVAILMMLVGCATYRITNPLEQPIDTAASWRIGEIKDALPQDMDPEDRPETGDITLLAAYLKSELQKKKFFQEQGLENASKFEVIGTLMEFKKGSQFLRIVLGGIFGGNASLTVELQVRNSETSQILFAGNFKGTTQDWNETLDNCYKRVAADFAKALEKSNKLAVAGS
jgi:hypothetical protein